MDNFKMDSFCEQIVPVRKGIKQWALLCAIWVAAFVVVFLIVSYVLKNIALIGIGVLLIVGAFYGATRLSKLFDVEYEMIVVNKDMDIDKITAKSSRKRVLSIQLADVEEYGEYTKERQDRLAGKQFDARCFYCNPDDKAQYMIYKHPKKGKLLIVVSMNDKLKEEALKTIPRFVIHN